MRAWTETVRTAACPVLLLGIFLLAGGAAYRAYFAVPDVPEVAAVASDAPGIAGRAFMFIIDGFAPTHAFDPAVMPTFARLAAEGASGIARTSSMSLTAPCVYSLGTGRPGTLVLGILDFHAPEARVESLPRLIAATGRRIALAGDASWQRQFGWLARPEDLHAVVEPGVTLDPKVRVADRTAVEFLLPKIRDPAYGLAVVHVGSADAVGHVVTPSGHEYLEALTFLDGLLAQVATTLPPDTVLLVTGDHGLGPRGTHGGRDDEATLTPYLLWGPGVRPDAHADIPQTAIVPTLAALLGLPAPAVSEYPPRTDLLSVEPDAAERLQARHLERKLAAARAFAPGFVLAPDLGAAAANQRLNEVLFGANDPRLRFRLLAASITAFGIGLALVLGWRSRPRTLGPLPLPGYLAGALAVPAAFATGAAVLISWRSWLPFQPDVIAGALALALLGTLAAAATALYRSAALRSRLERWYPALFFAVVTVLNAPLVMSGWFSPRRSFQMLALTLALGCAVVGISRRTSGAVRGVAWLPVSLVGLVYWEGTIPRPFSGEWSYLLPLSCVTLGIALWNLREARPARALGCGGMLVAAFAAAWVWRAGGGTPAASAVLALSLATMASAALTGGRAEAAATLVIGGVAALALMLANDGREALVFLAAAVGALLLARHRLSLHRPRTLYIAVGLAILVRICLYFELGDQYDLSSIRTAPGFRMVESGLPLATVVGLLMLKYALPWLLILGAALPSLVEAGRETTRHVADLLALGYAARFAVIAAVADPFRILPHGMEGIVGLFCISWAELGTLAVAGAMILAAVYGATGADHTAGTHPDEVAPAGYWRAGGSRLTSGV